MNLSIGKTCTFFLNRLQLSITLFGQADIPSFLLTIVPYFNMLSFFTHIYGLEQILEQFILTSPEALPTVNNSGSVIAAEFSKLKGSPCCSSISNHFNDP